ncbi:MAG: preprotein translocase subunit SecA [Gammaproteobacteria bacterium]|nr:preprotein translocase subunit SecA [Gammaproteobacteria bacterium]
MISNLIKNIFGSRNSRILKEYTPIINQINSLEKTYQGFTQADFIKETENLKKTYASEKNLTNIIPKAFALVREASIRTLGLRHFDEQLIGGLALHFGKIAEMKTGEGKTLVSTLPAYLNSLTSQSVFIVTVNDYLAQRDSEWMGVIYKYLGLSVGTISSNLSTEEKKEIYKRDIVYGTNNEFGFDYLRDNMVYDITQKVQGKLNYAIIDEVDSVLIDEARTPLVISGSASESTNMYLKINKLTQLVISGNKDNLLYSIDEKQKSVSLTENGHQEVESLLIKNNFISKTESLYDPKNIQLLHLIDSSLKANLLFNKDIDYVVENNEIVIIDEFSGRKMPGRRWSEGIHQSIEAKEKVAIQNENQTYASITFQNYFRLFKKISGMTGTADTESVEFQQIYNLEVIVVPTHKKMIRKDHVDLVYLTVKEKFNAIVSQVKEIHLNKQPILIGTTSIEASEDLSKMLKKENIKHSVLNAKQHQMEAEIIAEAGKSCAVTIATNMAGRGTDIVLGGKNNNSGQSDNKVDRGEDAKNVKELGGLFIIGTERHESRRVDNQLRGRSGRQGDPGESKFYVSLEDNLMRIFASDKVSDIMKKLGMEEGEAIEHKWVAKSIENAQKRVEAYNFDIRKTLLEYDDIANEQRKVIYNQRDEILNRDNLLEIIINIVSQTVNALIYNNIDKDLPVTQWDLGSLNDVLIKEFTIDINCANKIETEKSDNAILTLEKYIDETLLTKIQSNLKLLNDKDKNELIRNIFLTVIDEDWRNHLSAMDYLRQGVGLRGYAQKNPKNEYKRESFEMFEEMLTTNNYEVVKILCRIKVNNPSISEMTKKNENINNKMETDKNSDSNIPRNSLCPCGSGKKYKRCCGKL